MSDIISTIRKFSAMESYALPASDETIAIYPRTTRQNNPRDTSEKSRAKIK